MVYSKNNTFGNVKNEIETQVINDSPTVKDWTFMVYLDGDNNLEAAAIDDLNEMEAAGGSTSNINIIVLIDLSESDTSADSVYGVTWTDARLYYVEAGTNPDEIESTLLSEEGELNMGKGSTLRNFVDFVHTNYPANKYGISLWDHGGGIDGLCWDSSSNDDFLTINELQEALAGYHFDFLGMDACIMGQYEIIYEMRTCADFVGVSLLNEPGDGWDYEHFLPYLLADPSLTGDELGTYVCQTYVDQYSSAVTFGIWNTTDMTRVQEEMENLTIVLLKNLETYSGEIGEARALATSNGYPNYGADLYEFIENLENSSSAVIVQQANKTLAALKDINIMSYSNLPEIPFGLWIYFPRIPNEDYNKFYFNSNETHVDFSSNPYYGLDFVLNSSWEEFINAWRDALPTALYNINDKEQLTVSTSIDEYFAIELFAGDKVDVKLEVGEPGGPELYLYNSLGQLVDSDDSIT
ncbi:MAG: clostripain-related cysteine peptidase, partial [Candidatus Heimdallarchaeaceae archaeon]